MPAELLTVAICTYNRADSLANTLDSLVTSRLYAQAVKTQILVVDNNSTDETQAVIAGFRSLLPLRWVREEIQGLSHARNRALMECRGEVILFTDDDVRVDKYWLRAYRAALARFPGADFFGGRILPDWRGRRPRWMKEERMALLDGIFVHYDLGVAVRPYQVGDPLPFGASFALRRRLFDRLAPFNTDLGVKGDSPGRGEESEYLERAVAVGASGVYVGDALCWHDLDPARWDISYLFEHGKQKGIAEARMTNGGLKAGSAKTAFVFIVKGIIQLLKGRGDRFRQCVINAGIQIGMKEARR